MRVAALILAAGRSTRFGSENKLLAEIDGAPMLAHVIRRVHAARLADCLVVTGHEAALVSDIAAGERAHVAHNPDFAAGLATSLRAGIVSLPEEVDAALILLGDMPLVRPETMRLLIDALSDAPEMVATVPVYQGQWGNPVLMRRALFPALMQLAGDAGARKLIAGRADIIEMAVDDPGILADFDTKTALQARINSSLRS